METSGSPSLSLLDVAILAVSHFATGAVKLITAIGPTPPLSVCVSRFCPTPHDEA